MPPIRLADEVTKSINEPLVSLEFGGERGLTGAEVFARACKEEGLAALFCCPGNYTMINAISGVGIPSYGGRIEDIGFRCAGTGGRASGGCIGTGPVVRALQAAGT